MLMSYCIESKVKYKERWVIFPFELHWTWTTDVQHEHWFDKVLLKSQLPAEEDIEEGQFGEQEL